MQDTIGLLGILVAFFIVTYFTYKGFQLAYVVVLATIVVIVTSGLPILETFNDPIMTGVASQVPTLLPLYLFGAIFGKMFIDSGAAHSLSRSLLNKLGKNASPDKKRLIGFLCILSINIIFNYVGVDPFASLFTMIGIATGVMAQANIPRKYMPVILVLGATLGNVMPGSLAVPNIVCMNFIKGTSPWSAAIPGLVFIIFVGGMSLYYINKQIKKDVENGLGFEYGPLEPVSVDIDNLPPAIAALIPLVSIPVCFNTFASSAPWAAMAIGCIVGIICFGRFIPKKDGRSRIMTIANSMNDGVTIAGIPAIILLNFALGYAIQAAPSFQIIVDKFTSLPGPALLSLALMGTLLLGAAASMSGLIISLGIAASIFIPTLGVAPDAAYRTLLLTTTVLDSMPFCGAIVAMMAITGISYKEGYPPIAMTTILFTFLGLMISTVLMIVFPGII